MRALLCWLAVAACTVSASGQSPQPFASGTTAITVDVVVRDKHGKPVTDLTRDDFQLFEDGVAQQLADMTLVAPEMAARGDSIAGAPTKEQQASRSAVTAPTFVALVFDRLSPEGRYLAWKGAQAYLSTQHEDDFAGVFLADLSLVTIQTYTNDRLKLAAALKDVTSRATSRFDRDAIRAPGKSLSDGDSDASVPIVASPESPGRPIAGGGVTGIGPRIIAMTGISDSLWKRMAMNQQGFATTNALLALIGGLGTLPGRKTIVFFAEGLAIPEAVLPHFQSVITSANRANVSIYAIDAAGLKVHGEEAEVAREVNAVGELALSVNERGESSNGTGSMEAMANAIRSSPHTSLTLLADRTGGFLINNTNDLGASFHTIDQDRRFHYLLSYTPKNTDFNGEWRSIIVKVPAREVQIRARSGYVAIQGSSQIPLLDYEGRAIADLNRRPPPSQLPVRAGAFVFPQPKGESRLAIVATTSAGLMAFDTTAAGFRTDFTLLAQLRDAAGDVVRKGSQPYRLTGRLADRDRAAAQDVIFYRQPTLPAGTYTLDVVADDAIARKAGVMRMPITMPAPTSGPDASSLVIVQRAEKLAPGTAPANELTAGDVQFYPNLGEPLKQSDSVSFYAAILPRGQTVSATLTLARGTMSLATLPLELGQPDATGRIQQTGQIPLKSVPPGTYDLRLTVHGGPEPVVRTATFSVEP